MSATKRRYQEQSDCLTRLPEAEALHLLLVVAHRGVTVRGAVQVLVDELLEISSDDLVCEQAGDKSLAVSSSRLPGEDCL